MPALPEDRAVLFTPNHISWWDGFFADYLNRIYFKRIPFVMMLEKQLRRYLILNKLGAYSIDPDSPKEINESINYTRNLLSDRRNLVIFYPEGILKPFDTKISRLRRGILKLTENLSGSFIVLPAAFKISYYNERLPEIYAFFGPAMDSKELKYNFELYESQFIKNIETAHEASLERSYNKDLFE